MAEPVTLRHPELPEGQTITVRPETVDIWKAAGWLEPAKSRQPTEKPES